MLLDEAQAAIRGKHRFRFPSSAGYAAVLAECPLRQRAATPRRIWSRGKTPRSSRHPARYRLLFESSPGLSSSFTTGPFLNRLLEMVPALLQN